MAVFCNKSRGVAGSAAAAAAAATGEFRTPRTRIPANGPGGKELSRIEDNLPNPCNRFPWILAGGSFSTNFPL
jgi:hypothetical protein